MKLKDWMAFNQPFMDCDFKVKLIKNGSFNRDDIIFETIARWDVCNKFFGDYTIAKLKIDRYFNSDSACFCLLLWDDKEEV